MHITAVLAIRNEEAYLVNCLRHLIRHGIDFVIIDNGSSDASGEIYRRREFARNLVDVQDLPFRGAFSLCEQLQRKMKVIEALNTDWVVHLDADEVMHSYREGETLAEALVRLDAAGWNVVDFDEFVFLPVEQDYVPDTPGYQPIPHYYLFQPYSPRLMRAWNKASGFSLVENAGHVLTGFGLRLAPENLALRHYMVRNQEHAFTKYLTRIFDTDELARGWHQARREQTRDWFTFPAAAVLRRLHCVEQQDLDRTNPWKLHYWRLAALERAPRVEQAAVKADAT